nr:succinylglutamate desuccinylase/aspartoacylase family protein [Burkholderia cenocepacia]
MILALTHGNEVSGAIAVDALLTAGLRPVAGRLSLGFGNVGAYEHFSAENADATRYLDEDMNRVWTPAALDGTRDSRELARARAMRPLLDTVDLLLDIHSMHEASAPLMMTGPLDKAIALAAALGTPEHVIVDRGHANGTRLRDYGGFGDPASAKNALLIETGQHFAASARGRARQRRALPAARGRRRTRRRRGVPDAGRAGAAEVHRDHAAGRRALDGFPVLAAVHRARSDREGGHRDRPRRRRRDRHAVRRLRDRAAVDAPSRRERHDDAARAPARTLSRAGRRRPVSTCCNAALAMLPASAHLSSGRKAAGGAWPDDRIRNLSSHPCDSATRTAPNMCRNSPRRRTPDACN